MVIGFCGGNYALDEDRRDEVSIGPRKGGVKLALARENNQQLVFLCHISIAG